MTPGSDTMVGANIGHIRVIEAIGRGGMGEVYRGVNTWTNLDVAIKRVAPHLRSDAGSRRRIIQEARAIAPFLKHPHIVGISDVVESGHELFLIMEWIDGPNLRQRIDEGITPEESLRIIVQCAEALRAAHERGIIHRDIKPENIMLTSDGTVRVCDFGIAATVTVAGNDSTLRENATTSPAQAGTPNYFAPETLLGGEYGPHTDIFSLGIVFYELLTGVHPFRSDNTVASYDRILHHHPDAPSKTNPRVAPAIENIVLRMLAKNPDVRYRDAAELLADLQTATSGPRSGHIFYLATVGAAIVVSVYLAFNMPAPLRKLLGETALPTDINLAVLPFRLANAADDSGLADGLTEILTANLSKLHGRPSYQVVPATEVRTRAVDSPAKARQEFGATLVLAGTFQSDGSSVRISYALIDTKTSLELRRGSTRGTTDDPFQLQDQVTDDVLNLLSIDTDAVRRTDFERPRTANPQAELANRRGRGYLQNYGRLENADKAVAAFEEALSADAQFAAAYAGLGEAYLRKFSMTRERDWLEKASSACARAAKLDSRLSMSYLCLGMVESSSGQYERAAAEFRTALELDPKNGESLNQLAKVQEQLGDVAGAEDTHKRAIVTQPYHWTSYAALGEFYNRQHRYSEAIAQWRQAVALSGDNGQAYNALGAAHINAGQYAAAVRILQRAVVLRPHWDSYSNLGHLYMRLRRYPEAASALEKAVTYGQDYRVTGNLARIYRILGNTEKARKTYERGILEGDRELGVNPRNPDIHILMARYYAYVGRKPEALIHVQFALAMKPTDRHYLEIAAGVYDQVGERQKAIQTLQEAFKLGLPPTRLETEIELAGLKAHPQFSSLLKADR
ncbi:MAG: protein kinase [Acidobacteria bacterium]|nr:protein kinase [Acidobacteriota bacterium]